MLMFWRGNISRATLLSAALIFVHEAPSGWQYPYDCCNAGDCHPVSCAAIREVEGGVEFAGVKFLKKAIRQSQDGFCHVCIGIYGPQINQHIGHCIFMTPRT